MISLRSKKFPELGTFYFFLAEKEKKCIACNGDTIYRISFSADESKGDKYPCCENPFCQDQFICQKIMEKKDLDINMGDWVEYGQHSVVKIVGIKNSMLVGYVFIPNMKGGFQYVGRKSVPRNLIQDYFRNQEKIQEMEELLCQM